MFSFGIPWNPRNHNRRQVQKGRRNEIFLPRQTVQGNSTRQVRVIILRESKTAKPYLKISCAVVPTEPSSWTADGASGTTPGMSCDGLWRTYSGTMLADRESDGKAQISVTMPAVRTIGGVACKGPCAGNLTGYVGKWWIVRPAYFLDLRAFLT